MDENSICHGNNSLDTLATTQNKRKKPSERSEIWDQFTKYDLGNKCKCNYCGNDYASVTVIGETIKNQFWCLREILHSFQPSI